MLETCSMPYLCSRRADASPYWLLLHKHELGMLHQVVGDFLICWSGGGNYFTCMSGILYHSNIPMKHTI